MDFKRNFLSDRSDESLLAEIHRVAAELGKESLTQDEFGKHARVSTQVIKKRFGTWNKALVMAGLRVAKWAKVTNAEIFAEIDRVWSLLGHRPTKVEFDKLSNISAALLKKRFGSLLKAYEEFLEFKGTADPASIVPTASAQIVHIMSGTRRRSGSRRYGNLINFRGMQHAPLNELGVVFLFGMLAKELGFVVEAIGAEFPDCEAKRLGETNEFWEKVAIEFEYKSTNFVQHKHDPSKCDLIVCWTHDWTECPIEVLELSSELKKITEDG